MGLPAGGSDGGTIEGAWVGGLGVAVGAGVSVGGATVTAAGSDVGACDTVGSDVGACDTVGSAVGGAGVGGAGVGVGGWDLRGFGVRVGAADFDGGACVSDGDPVAIGVDGTADDGDANAGEADSAATEPADGEAVLGGVDDGRTPSVGVACTVAGDGVSTSALLEAVVALEAAVVALGVGIVPLDRHPATTAAIAKSDTTGRMREGLAMCRTGRPFNRS